MQCESRDSLLSRIQVFRGDERETGAEADNLSTNREVKETFIVFDLLQRIPAVLNFH